MVSDRPVFLRVPCENEQCENTIFGNVKEYADGGYGFDAYCHECKNEDELPLEELYSRALLAHEIPEEVIDRVR